LSSLWTGLESTEVSFIQKGIVVLPTVTRVHGGAAIFTIFGNYFFLSW